MACMKPRVQFLSCLFSRTLSGCSLDGLLHHRAPTAPLCWLATELCLASKACPLKLLREGDCSLKNKTKQKARSTILYGHRRIHYYTFWLLNFQNTLGGHLSRHLSWSFWPIMRRRNNIIYIKLSHSWCSKIICLLHVYPHATWRIKFCSTIFWKGTF